MKAKNYNNGGDLHYMKDHKWKSGELCYWRNNQNYSEKEKAKLEKRLDAMIDKRKDVKIYGF